MSQPNLIAACPELTYPFWVIHETEGHDQRCIIRAVPLLEQKGAHPHNLHRRAYQPLVAVHCFHVLAGLADRSG
jgi:hypothetical protein